ncbi:MAG: hypothetical protein AAGJ46_13215 [Planctomycetota bacterium]
MSGTISANGKPLVEAGVTFTPVGGGRPAWATTDEQGRFELTTFSDRDGALVGGHIVTVAERDTDVPQVPKNADPDAASLFAEMPTSSRPKPHRGAISQDYASRSTSDLRYTVEPGVSNTADFNLSK